MFYYLVIYSFKIKYKSLSWLWSTLLSYLEVGYHFADTDNPRRVIAHSASKWRAIYKNYHAMIYLLLNGMLEIKSSH